MCPSKKRSPHLFTYSVEKNIRFSRLPNASGAARVMHMITACVHDSRDLVGGVAKPNYVDSLPQHVASMPSDDQILNTRICILL